MTQRSNSSRRVVIPLTLAVAGIGFLLSPLTDATNAIGILLFTPPPWAVAGLILGLVIESRRMRG